MTAQELLAIVNSWRSGAISQDTMLELFRKGEVLPDGRTNEEETQLIAGDKSAGKDAALTDVNANAAV